MATLTDLTAVNQRLIGLLAANETTPAEEAEEDSILGAGADEAGYEDPDAEEEEDPEVRGRFKTVNPLEFNRIKEWVELNVFGGTGAGQAALIDAFVDEWDVEFRRKQGLGATDDLGVGATLDGLLSDEEFVNGAMWLPLTGTNQLPSMFATDMEEVDPETGEPTGNLVQYVAVASPLTGVEFRTVEQVAARGSAEDNVIFNRAIRTGGQLATDLYRSAIKSGVAGNIPIPGGQGTLTHVGDQAGEGVQTQTRRPVAPPVPEVTQDQINALYAEAVGSSSSRSGGGGGGGGARREIVFDRDKLVADVADLYDRRMLLATEAPLGKIGSWVDSYVREAQAFWSQKGGQLDFDTYINAKLEKDPRYQQIYRDKLPGESPEQFLEKFRAPIASLGMTGDFTRGQTEASILSGGGPDSQFQRVSRTREVQTANQGGFSQRFAQTLAGIGVG